MTHASVFSGIGGPEVAATMLGWENLFHCEINPFGRQVLDYWYPNSKSYEDITTTDFTEWRGRVDVLTGGFPCQPFSYAGRRRGAEDDRYLWPSMYRAIDEIQPTWVVAENVAGILTMVEQGEVSKVAGMASLFDEDNILRRYRLEETFTLQRICKDLQDHGYSVQPVLVPACAVGAPHRRDRVFIVGHRDATDNERRSVRGSGEGGSQYGGGGSIEHASSGRLEVSHDTSRPTTDERRSIAKISRTTPHPDSHRGSEVDEHMESELADGAKPVSNGGQRNVADTSFHRLARLLQRKEHEDAQWQRQIAQDITDHIRSVSPDYGRWEAFPSVSPVHRGNDGLPFDVDRLTLSFGKWRTEALKAYGNAIVPQVMYEIFRAIEITDSDNKHYDTD